MGWNLPSPSSPFEKTGFGDSIAGRDLSARKRQVLAAFPGTPGVPDLQEARLAQ